MVAYDRGKKGRWKKINDINVHLNDKLTAALFGKKSPLSFLNIIVFQVKLTVTTLMCDKKCEII